jgi:hypothetical protein
MTSAALRAQLADMHPDTRRMVEAQLARHPDPPERPTGLAALRAARVPGRMTKTENLYAMRLEQQKDAGLILAYDYECDRLKLADPVTGGRCNWFKVDFTVTHADGHTSWDEVKGSWASQRGIERFRWLCSRYPARHLRLWKYESGVWRLALESGRNQSCAGIVTGAGPKSF